MLVDAKAYTRDDVRTMTNSMLTVIEEDQLLSALSDTQEESLDAMLETQPGNIQAAGKRIIAKTILRAENKGRGVAKDGCDWFSYLFSRMTEGVANVAGFFHSNDVTFITYNYDRLIEYKLTAGVHSKYQIDVIHPSLMNGKVIHLHGSVGDFHASPRQVPFGVGFADPQSSEKHINAVLPWCDESIKIVHEPKPDADEFVRARAALARAERVLFLGFGFGRANVDRLNFGDIGRAAGIRYTNFGMTEAETILYIRQPLQRAGLSFSPTNSGWDCLRLIRESITDLVDRY